MGVSGHLGGDFSFFFWNMLPSFFKSSLPAWTLAVSICSVSLSAANLLSNPFFTFMLDFG